MSQNDLTYFQLCYHHLVGEKVKVYLALWPIRMKPNPDPTALDWRPLVSDVKLFFNITREEEK